MDTPKTPSFLTYLPAAIILSLIGWGGLLIVISQTVPTLGPRWMFFFLCVLALSGTSLPAAYFLHRRFPSTPPAEPGVIVREALWVGVYGSTLTWLQLGRMLTPAGAGILAGIFILIEGLLRMRERARWKPKE